MSASLFSAVDMAPRDPILGLTEQFQADPNPSKVNLGVGVYTDENGKLPLLACVKEAENLIAESPKPRGYLPIDGIAAYDQAVQSLVFGADSEPLRNGRVVTAQALGGTGALRVGADFLRRMNPSAKVLISDPSWENHRALFEAAGFEVGTYPYYDAAARGVALPAMLQALRAAPAGTIVVLHACCHNPTGYDLDGSQWQQVIEAVRAAGLVPFVDMAYQGFAEGIAEDGSLIGRLIEAGLSFCVASSFSKSFSLYGERVGALSIACGNRDEAQKVQSQLKRVIRTNYSNPPTHGAQLVTMVLSTPALRAQWEQELGTMRERIRGMRSALVDRLKAHGVQGNLDFIVLQRGMFSYSGLNPQQMERLRKEFGIYGIGTGRICIAALNPGNVDYVAQSIAAVMK